MCLKIELRSVLSFDTRNEAASLKNPHALLKSARGLRAYHARAGSIKRNALPTVNSFSFIPHITKSFLKFEINTVWIITRKPGKKFSSMTEELKAVNNLLIPCGDMCSKNFRVEFWWMICEVEYDLLVS